MKTGHLKQTGGFTLVEMLVVIGIIAIVLGVAMPAFRQREGIEVESASRQLMDDLSSARARAINGRTVVAVVFVPKDVLSMTPDDSTEGKQIKRLQAGVYTHYAFYSPRRVGDQPGRAHHRYLTDWKSLPEKTFIAESKFEDPAPPTGWGFSRTNFPFPFVDSKTNSLPYVAFDHEGRSVTMDGSPAGEIRIPIARGAILYTRDAVGMVKDYTVQEVPPGNSITSSNHIVIDWMTGRSRLERQEL